MLIKHKDFQENNLDIIFYFLFRRIRVSVGSVCLTYHFNWNGFAAARKFSIGNFICFLFLETRAHSIYFHEYGHLAFKLSLEYSHLKISFINSIIIFFSSFFKNLFGSRTFLGYHSDMFNRKFIFPFFFIYFPFGSLCWNSVEGMLFCFVLSIEIPYSKIFISFFFIKIFILKIFF